MKCGFSIKTPNKTRRSFSVHKKIYQVTGKPLQPLVKDERLDAINLNLKLGVLTESEALIQVKAFVDKLRAELAGPEDAVRQTRISEANWKAYRAFHKEHYTGKDIVRPHTVHNEFQFALDHIEPLSVVSTKRVDLQEKCDKVFDHSQHRRYVGRINQLLAFCGRDFKLHVKKRGHSEVDYVTLPELQTILAKVSEPDLKALYLTLWGTGVRLGEAFTVRDRDIKPKGLLYIKSQLTDGLEITGLKNDKPHHTVIIPECMPAVMAWGKLSAERKRELRTRCQHPLINASEGKISPHDLRHSYVIHMLGLGVPLDKVAKLIGDSISTTERYYAGYTMSGNEVDIVNTYFKSNKD